MPRDSVKSPRVTGLADQVCVLRHITLIKVWFFGYRIRKSQRAWQMIRHRADLMWRVIAAITLGLSGAPSRAAVDGSDARIVELIADRDNKFKLTGGQQAPLTLKSGETVRFRVTSFFGGEKAKDGALHSFVVRKLRDNDPAWSVRLKEGVQEFTVKAPKPGNYLIECTVECGPGHDNMNLKMVVVK